jgi:hypothetical protein
MRVCVLVCYANSFNAAYDALGGRSTKEIQRGLEISMALQTAVSTIACSYRMLYSYTRTYTMCVCVVVHQVAS